MRRNSMSSEVRGVPVPNRDPLPFAVIMYYPFITNLFISTPCSGKPEQCHDVLILQKTITHSTSGEACQGR